MSKANVVILGGNGMLGHMLSIVLSQNNNVICITRSMQLSDINFRLHDFQNLHSLMALIESLNPEVIINTTGVLVNASNVNPLEAIRINSFLPRVLEKNFSNTNVRLIQISTDCVFSGNNGPYTMNSIPDSKDAYGMTKFLGEINNSKDLTIRCSIVGPNIKSKNNGLFDWFFTSSNVVEGYLNAFWSGLTTLELSNFIDNNLFDGLSGLVMLGNGNVISKYTLLTYFNTVFLNSHKTINIDESIILNKGFLIANSNCLISKSYIQMLNELKDWMFTYKSIYSHYNFLLKDIK